MNFYVPAGKLWLHVKKFSTSTTQHPAMLQQPAAVVPPLGPHLRAKFPLNGEAHDCEALSSEGSLKKMIVLNANFKKFVL